MTKAPPWAFPESDFAERRLGLTIWVSSGRLVAVHLDGSLTSAVQAWLDKSPLPSYRRVPEGVIHAALLGGEAKSMWLRGAHPRRSTKADSKNISGVRLQDALDPFEDGSFALGAAKAELEPDPEFAALSGVIGTTPRKSTVWLRKAEDFRDFMYMCLDLLRLFDRCISHGVSVDKPYPWLATQIYDLSQVNGAFDLSVLSTSDLMPHAEWSEEAFDAAEILERAELRVRPTGVNTSASFLIDAGMNGKIGGVLRCDVVMDGRKARLKVGYDPESELSDASQVAPVFAALQSSELLTVHYGSGHAVVDGHIWVSEIATASFPSWRWSDYSGFNIKQEKPLVPTLSPQDIHDSIGEGGDRSLFAWVVANCCADGWLACDDGANEIADFVGLSQDLTLYLIHVKGASTDSNLRRANVMNYEVVASQAAKNLRYVSVDNLVDRLGAPTVARPATWYAGRRIPDRTEMIEYLKIRGAGALTRVLIVQPQMRQAAYQSARAPEAPAGEALRVQLLDTLLNSVRSSVTGLGADLEVFGSAG